MSAPTITVRARRLFVGLAALVLCMSFGWAVRTAPASAHVPTPCVLTSLPAFVETGSNSTVADVIELSCEPAVFAGKPAEISSTQLFDRCDHSLSWEDLGSGSGAFGTAIKVTLDASGNAQVFVSGSICAEGESLIEANTEEAPFESLSTGFTVLPPHTTVPAAFAFPGTAVESAESGTAATIVQVEFPPEDAGEPVYMRAGALFSACEGFSKLTWTIPTEGRTEGGVEVNKVRLDNEGNAFVILNGERSCTPGTYVIQAGLETAPFTAYQTHFTLQAPPVLSETSLVYHGPSTVAIGDRFTAKATLVPHSSTFPGNLKITMQIGAGSGESCTGVTNNLGEAECELETRQPPGTHTLTVSFAGGPELQASLISATVAVSRDETRLTYLGPDESLQKTPFTVSAKLEDPDGGTPIAGEPVTFSLAKGKKNGCTATTNAVGVAECEIKTSLKPGPYTLTATFAGDGESEPSSASTPFEILDKTSACSISSLPSFVDQGEFGEASSIADIIQVHCAPVYAEQLVELHSQQLYNRCARMLSWSAVYAPLDFREGPAFKAELDDDGNATVALWGGPSCAAGDSLISADLLAPPYTTFTTHFTVLAPTTTPAGVFALPSSETEDATTSSFATIVQLEFPPFDAEKYVRVDAEQLFARCKVPPHLLWIGPDEQILSQEGHPPGPEEAPQREEVLGREEATVQLDNDGNAFVVLFGSQSCAAGTSLIEASLEELPYTTFTTQFTIEPPSSPAS